MNDPNWTYVESLKLWVMNTLVKQGAFGMAPEGFSRSQISYFDAERYATARSARIMTADEWDIILAAAYPQISIGDMWEWTSTCEDNLYIYRGGSWYLGPSRPRVAYRDAHDPSYAYGGLGFRLVKDNKD